MKIWKIAIKKEEEEERLRKIIIINALESSRRGKELGLRLSQ